MGSVNVFTLGGYPLWETKGPPWNEGLSLFTAAEFTRVVDELSRPIFFRFAIGKQS